MLLALHSAPNLAVQEKCCVTRRQKSRDDVIRPSIFLFQFEHGVVPADFNLLFSLPWVSVNKGLL